MYWCGDSKTVIRKRWLSLWNRGGLKTVWKEEILCGYNFGIPLCCITWYILTVYMCLIFRRDAIIMTLMLGESGWGNFCKRHYYRCPLCRGLNYWRQVKFGR